MSPEMHGEFLIEKLVQAIRMVNLGKINKFTELIVFFFFCLLYLDSGISGFQNKSAQTQSITIRQVQNSFGFGQDNFMPNKMFSNS